MANVRRTNRHFLSSTKKLTGRNFNRPQFSLFCSGSNGLRVKKLEDVVP